MSGTDKQLAKILAINSLTDYIIEKVDTNSEQRFENFEKLLNKTYNDLDNNYNHFKHSLEIGSHVCVLIEDNKNQKNVHKKWFRGEVIQMVWGLAQFRYIVFLVDYGREVLAKRQDMHPIRHSFSQQFLEYKAIHFKLIGFQNNLRENDKQLIEYIKQLFISNNYIVLSDIRSKYVSNKTILSGRIQLNDGSDLTNHLIEKHFSADDSKQTESKHKSIEKTKIKRILRKNKEFEKRVKDLIDSHENQSTSGNSLNTSITSLKTTVVKTSINSQLISEKSDKESILKADINGNALNGQKYKLDDIDDRLLYLRPDSKESEEVIDWPVFQSNGPVVRYLPAGVLPATQHQK